MIRWPSAEYRAALAAVLGADPKEPDALGFRPSVRPAADPTLPEPYPDDGLLALAERAETTEIGGAAVEALEEVVDLLARAYAGTDPAVLLVQVRRRAGEVAVLLDRRSTLAQRRRLLVVGGWLALLGATLHVDLGDRAAAVGARSAAASLGRETDHRELAAWAVEIAAWTALTDQDWSRAARLAADGEALAPAGSSAAVQLAAQSARAAARLGDGPGVRAGLARAEAGVDQQIGDRPPDHHFRFDGRKLDGYTATALAWSGDPAGEGIAREVAGRYAAGPRPPAGDRPDRPGAGPRAGRAAGRGRPPRHAGGGVRAAGAVQPLADRRTGRRARTAARRAGGRRAARAGARRCGRAVARFPPPGRQAAGRRPRRVRGTQSGERVRRDPSVTAAIGWAEWAGVIPTRRWTAHCRGGRGVIPWPTG